MGKRLNPRGRQLTNGIHEAFTRRIGKDAEVRTARDGKPWQSFPWRWTPRPTQAAG